MVPHHYSMMMIMMMMMITTIIITIIIIVSPGKRWRWTVVILYYPEGILVVHVFGPIMVRPRLATSRRTWWELEWYTRPTVSQSASRR